MSKEYDLHCNGKKVGFVKLSRRGMFYVLTCRFHSGEQGIFRLFAGNGEAETDLGQCVRYGQVFGAERCLPIKSVGEGELRFFLRAENEEDAFFPVSGNQPFPRLDKLLNAKFSVRDGAKGILLKD